VRGPLAPRSAAARQTVDQWALRVKPFPLIHLASTLISVLPAPVPAIIHDCHHGWAAFMLGFPEINFLFSDEV
jgi:hypothetical protein